MVWKLNFSRVLNRYSKSNKKAKKNGKNKSIKIRENPLDNLQTMIKVLIVSNCT